MDSDPRTRDARARAEEALARFALLAIDHLDEFVVIGGLNPDFLAPAAPVPHTGTTDVDLLFEIGFIYERDELDFAWLDRLIETEGFLPQSEAGWRWDALLGAAKVRLDLLCDVPDHPGQVIALPGSINAATMNLAGPSPALLAPVTRHIAVPPSVRAVTPGLPSQVSLRFANLGGYLLAKSAAAQSRNLPKDVYDLLYVILYNPDGPQGAAEAVAQQLARMEGHVSARAGIFAIMRDCTLATGREARAFAESMRDSGDESTEEQLRQDAAYAARRFLDVFDG